MSIFEGLKDAKTSERNPHLKPGKYTVRVKKAFTLNTRTKGTAFIIELDVISSSYADERATAIKGYGDKVFDDRKLEESLPNRPNTVACWYQSLKDTAVGFGSLKSFAAGVLGMKLEDPMFLAHVEGFIEAVADKGHLDGALLPVEVVNIKTKEGKDFGLHKWSKQIEETAAAGA